MNALPLPGCAPTPLAHYLKALGVLRLLAEQLPPDLPRPRGAWQGDTFVLHSSLDRAGLEKFFLRDYRPTPILAPWNGGSGFFEGDKQDGISAIAASAAPRFQDFREGIESARNALSRLRLAAKPEKEAKHALLQLSRSQLPDRALEWLDAALVPIFASTMLALLNPVQALSIFPSPLSLLPCPLVTANSVAPVCGWRTLSAMFSHVVIFWTEPTVPNAADELMAGIEQYLRPIPGITGFQVGRMVPSHRPVVDQTYQVGLYVSFADQHAHDEYQVHPLHLEFVERVFKRVCRRVAVYDFAK